MKMFKGWLGGKVKGHHVHHAMSLNALDEIAARMPISEISIRVTFANKITVDDAMAGKTATALFAYSFLELGLTPSP